MLFAQSSRVYTMVLRYDEQRCNLSAYIYNCTLIASIIRAVMKFDCCDRVSALIATVNKDFLNVMYCFIKI